MKLSAQELQHVHKVLSSDIDECTVLIGDDMTDNRVTRLSARMEDDRRVLARVESVLGFRPEWEPVKDEGNHRRPA